MNCIINNFSNIQVPYVANNGVETLNAIQKSSFDLILLDLNLPDINGIDIIRKLQCNNITINSKIIVISGDTQLINELRKSPIVVNVINKCETCEQICNKIQNYIQEQEFITNKSLIKKRIIEELSYIGYNFKHKGSQYIMETILCIYTNNKDFYLLNNLEKQIYKYIAYNHNTSINNIKTNIIRATELAYTCQDEDIINNYFNVEIKMKPKDVISKILTEISKI